MIPSRLFSFLPKPLLRPRALQPCQASAVRSKSGSIHKSRFFHATPAPQFLDVCVDQVQTFITGIHSVSGLPWAASLPLTALIVRSVLIAPLSVIAHKAIGRRLALIPLIHAWKHVIHSRVMRNNRNQGPVMADRLTKRALRSKIRGLYSRHECGPLRLYLPFLQLPVFLIMMESIRRMCAAGEGLLGLLTKGPIDPVEKSRDDILGEVSQTAASLEHSLSQEGALWFPDLLAPDPLLVLPFLLSGSLFASISYESRKPRLEPSKSTRRFTNALKIMALATGPLTLQAPSALVLYWLSSSLIVNGQHVLLDWYYPRGIPITPCKPKGKQI